MTQELQPLSHGNICAKKKTWKNHMRDTICAKTKFQASRCKNAVLSKKTPPNELRNIDFTLDCRAFSKIQPQNSLKNIGGVTLSESKHNKITIILLMPSTDFANILKTSLYFAKSMLRKHKFVVENQYSGELQDAKCYKLQ